MAYFHQEYVLSLSKKMLGFCPAKQSLSSILALWTTFQDSYAVEGMGFSSNDNM